jgi:hypothetical protein
MTQHQKLGWAEKEARRDYIPKATRGGEGAVIIGIVLVILFFYAHQAWSTGFFTAGFGGFEAFLLYGSVFSSAVGPVTRSITGSRNSARLSEIFASTFWIISSALLLTSFPFNFAHVGDVVPEFLRFLASWITNDIAWALLAVGMAGGIAFITVTAVLYIRVKTLLQSAHHAR